MKPVYLLTDYFDGAVDIYAKRKDAEVERKKIIKSRSKWIKNPLYLPKIKRMEIK